MGNPGLLQDSVLLVFTCVGTHQGDLHSSSHPSDPLWLKSKGWPEAQVLSRFMPEKTINF
jgi:hypothetical protein